MKKIFIIITLAAIFPLSGCASFKQIDTTDVIPNKNQINI
jgi:protein involved in sex pheromone biosynthesis